MRILYQRLALLAGLLFLLGISILAAPPPVHANGNCVCLHWSGLDGPCDDCCKSGYTYCQSTGGKGSYTCSTDKSVSGPCAVFSSTQTCDNFFGCIVCTSWSSGCCSPTDPDCECGPAGCGD